VDGSINNPIEVFDGTETFTASVDSDFDHSTDPMCKTLDANINKVGDWYGDQGSSGGGTQADPTTGEFSIRLDANNSSYQDKISTDSEENSTLFELLAYEAGTGDLIYAIQFDFRCFNIIDDASSVPPEPDSDYYTKAQSDARYGAQLSAGVVSIADGADSVIVSGLSLSATPSVVMLTVHKPGASDQNLWASVRDGTISTAGFTADLSAVTDKSGYKLSYLLFE
jgi:hypothetical protein